MTKVLVDSVEICIPLRDEDLDLRVEIFELTSQPGMFSARLWRIEHYRIQPTFPQVDSAPAHLPSDEAILKAFEGMETSLATPKPFENVESARNYVIAELAVWLGSQAGGEQLLSE